jgi:CheY-like chemotaxis protein
MSTTQRILCIDDDARIRDTLKTLLAADAYEVWETGSGQEGLELAAKKPDLIILDIGLPDLDGFEVCKRLKAGDATRTIPILMLSGEFTEDEHRVTGLEGGGDAYLIKPVPNRVLLATVHALLRLPDAERALTEALGKAEAASAAKTRFLSRITHRLRLPLNAIIGFSGQLADSALTPRQLGCADGIRGNSQRLLALVNDLLDATRLDVHGIALEASDFDPRAACADVFAMLREETAVKPLVLDCVCAPDMPVAVRTDVGRFRQVLAHLVENAIQFTPRGGVTVRLAGGGNAAQGESLRVEVQDTGPGVPAEMRPSLFQPLAILMNAELAPESGPGLGLAIAHAVVELMGGSMGYHPAEQGGALFWFEIPAPLPVAVTPEPPVSEGPHASATIRVLLVDDNAVNRKVAGKILAGLGCDVVLAAGGQEAVDLARRGGVDLVFMDLHMPDMDGFEATRRLREARAGKDVAPLPIIALTAQTDDESKQRCAQARMDGYITKPVSRDALAQVLAGMLPRPGAMPKPDDGAGETQADDADTPQEITRVVPR